jgi:hypothetical protein
VLRWSFPPLELSSSAKHMLYRQQSMCFEQEGGRKAGRKRGRGTEGEGGGGGELEYKHACPWCPWCVEYKCLEYSLERKLVPLRKGGLEYKHACLRRLH